MIKNIHPIRQYRNKRGLTQKALAREIGVTQGLVWKWETQNVEIPAERAVSIEEKIGEDLPAETLSVTLQRYEDLKTRRQEIGKCRHATPCDAMPRKEKNDVPVKLWLPESL